MGACGCAALGDDHLFPVDPVANDHCVPGSNLLGRLGDGFPRAFRAVPSPASLACGLRCATSYVAAGTEIAEGEQQPPMNVIQCQCMRAVKQKLEAETSQSADTTTEIKAWRTGSV